MKQKPLLSRYERHVDIPEIGVEGQEKLMRSAVLVVGLGGLGCPAALYLVAAGIGRIGIVDADTVSLSNLQRQVLYREGDIGAAKADVAARELGRLSSACKVEAHPFFLAEGNAVALVEKYDLVLDCTDNFDARYLLNRACYAGRKPLVSASLYHHDGQISVFKAHVGAEHPCYHCLYPQTDKLELLPNCREGGIAGPVAGILGSMQASVAMNELLGIGAPVSGTMILFNALTFDMQKVALVKRPDCRVCGADAPAFSAQNACKNK